MQERRPAFVAVAVPVDRQNKGDDSNGPTLPAVEGQRSGLMVRSRSVAASIGLPDARTG